jgi:hypothetical protein
VSSPLLIIDAKLSRSLAGPAGEERYLLDVSLKGQGEKPVERLSLEVLAGKEVAGAADFDFERLEAGEAGSRTAKVVLFGLAGPGRGGWADFPAWLREGRGLEVRVQSVQTTWIFTRWLKLPRLSDRKTFRVKASSEGGEARSS